MFAVYFYWNTKQTRSLFVSSESGAEWRTIVDEFLSEKVLITKMNQQTGHLELHNSNNSSELDMKKESMAAYLDRFWLKVDDCIAFKPLVAEKKVSLKQYLMHRHTYMESQRVADAAALSTNKTSISLIKGSENSFSQIT